jgi:zinc transporter, ZIP family
MIESIKNSSPIIQALAAGLFTWSITAFGASFVFVTKKVSKKLLESMLGFAGGVMMAASFWSLLSPSIGMSKGSNMPSWMPAAVGFLIGGIFLGYIDKLIPHFRIGSIVKKNKNANVYDKSINMLILAVTLHNIPEGLAIGVAFGAVAAGIPSATLPAAVALAIGIGIQNFPEGLAISMPLRGSGMSRSRSFHYGQLSAVVEPIASLIGAWTVMMIRPVLPYALGFAAGAMFFVVIEEIIPSSQGGANGRLATAFAMIGFVLMMALDVAFG